MSTRPIRQIVALARHARLVHEIRVSFDAGRWKAHVVTLPNHIWVEPGGKRALAFEAGSPEKAEEMAAAFIHRDSISRGHRLSEASQAVGDTPAAREPARRRRGCYPVRFAPRSGAEAEERRRARAASTENLSETGLFISTNAPLPPGSRLDIDVRLPGLAERLSGVVVWSRCEPGSALDNGMGVQLVEPSLAYRAVIQTLS